MPMRIAHAGRLWEAIMWERSSLAIEGRVIAGKIYPPHPICSILRGERGFGSLAFFETSFKGRRDLDGGHSGCGCRLDAHVGVFEDEAVLWGDAEAGGGDEIGVGSGLAVLVVFRADDGFELVHEAKGGERVGDRVAAAAGDDGEGDAAGLGGGSGEQ